MTTKWKIISGFLLMMVLLAAVAGIGYRSLQEASKGFENYRRLAKFNAATNDMETCLNRMAYNTFRFLESKDSGFMKLAGEALKSAQERIKECEEYVVRPERKKMLETLSADTLEQEKRLVEIERGVLAGYNTFSNNVQNAVRDLTAELTKTAEQARDRQNTQALFEVSDVLKDLTFARNRLAAYAASRSPEDAKRVQESLDGMARSIGTLRNLAATEEAKARFAGIDTSFAALRASFAVMEKENTHSYKLVGEMEAALDATFAASGKVSGEVNDEMLQFGLKLLEANSSAQWQTLVVSLAGILLGAVFAGLIIIGLIRVLKDLAGFASAVSLGNFSYQIKTKEKGEIGGMVETMRQIPAVLETVMREAGTLVAAVLSGRFRQRLEVQAFAGAFANLARSVNSVGDAYTSVLDSLPLPLMTSSKEQNALFLNTKAQDALGGNLHSLAGAGPAAAGLPRADSYAVEALSKNNTVVGEAVIHPRNERMDIAVTALPLRDAGGNTTGYMEIVTDLTEIKKQQNTMLQVAADASAISDRVAAASEELSAQVEQISRGAEMQRARVESTASAMSEMNSTVLEVARNAGQASEQSEGTRRKAENGAALVGKVVTSINSVNTVAATLQDNMQDLGRQAESIGGVMNVISDIADQTNLLALNAAIEAARAGEAGRGFAVVADEVRKLAEKTMHATQEVGANISSIQQSARTNITEVDRAVKNIGEATELAGSSGAALQEIVDLAAANSSVVASIATAAEEQSATSEEINRSVEEINRIAGETTEGMIQSSSAVQELARMAQELRTVMDQLR